MLPPDPHHFSIALLVKGFFVCVCFFFSLPVQPLLSGLDVLNKRQVRGGFDLIFFSKLITCEAFLLLGVLTELSRGSAAFPASFRAAFCSWV